MEERPAPRLHSSEATMFSQEASTWLQKSLSGLPPHTLLRLRFFFYKIGTWTDNTYLQVKVNSTVVYQKTWPTLESPIFFNNLCGGSNVYLQNVEQVNIWLNTSTQSLTFKIGTTNSGSGFWAINQLIATTYFCDVSCLTCSGLLSSQCLSCPNGSFLNSASNCVSNCPSPYLSDYTTNTCVLSCPLSSYTDTSTASCRFCNADCTSCVGPLNNQCLGCIATKILNGAAPSNCNNRCVDGNYFNPTAGFCFFCDPPCKTCTDGGTQNCLTCTNNHYLQTQVGPSFCLKTCQTGYYPDNSTLICQKCYSTCLTCTNGSINGCTSCYSGLFLLGSSCVNKCPSGYFGDFVANTCLPCDINCKECQNANYTGCLSCNFQTYLDKTTVLSKTGTCLPVKTINPSLKSTANPLVFELTFYSPSYSNICFNYLNRSTISIENLIDNSSNFSISYNKSNDFFTISINGISSSITNSPKLTFYLNIPENLSIDYPQWQLTTTTLESQVGYYFIIDSSTMNTINKISDITNLVNSAISKTFILNSALSIGSFSFIYFTLSMDTIIFLRYLEIDYPANVVAIFKANLPNADLIPNIYVDENIEDKSLSDVFTKYNTSSYIFNNNGNNIIEAICYWFIGVLALILRKCFRDYDNKCIKILLILISASFIWNYCLSYFLSNFIIFSYFTFLTYNFPANETMTGQLNTVFAVFIGIFFVFMSFPYIWLKIRKIRLTSVLSSFSSISPTSPINVKDKDRNSIDQTKINDSINNKFAPTSFIKKNLTEKEIKSDNKIALFEIPDELLPVPIEISPIRKNKITSPSRFRRISMKIMNKIHGMKDKMKESVNNMLKSLSKEKPINKNTKKTVNSSESRNNFLTANPEIPMEIETPTLEKNKNFNDKNVETSRFFIIHKDFKQDNFWHSYFILWVLLKQIIYSFIIVVSYNKPFDGLIGVIVMEIIFKTTVVIFSPFKQKKVAVQFVFLELCVFLAMIFGLLIANDEKNGVIDDEMKIKLGWGIVFAYFVVAFSFVSMMIGKYLITLWEVLKECAKKIKNNRVGDENAETENGEKGILERILDMEREFLN